MKLPGRMTGPFSRFLKAWCGVLSVTFIITGRSNHAAAPARKRKKRVQLKVRVRFWRARLEREVILQELPSVLG
jgi:hypothetical protein